MSTATHREITRLTAAQTAAAIASGEISAVETARAGEHGSA